MNYTNIFFYLCIFVAVAAILYVVVIDSKAWLKQCKEQEEAAADYIKALKDKIRNLEDDLRDAALRELALHDDNGRLAGRAKLLAREIMLDDMNKHTLVFDKSRPMNVMTKELIVE